MVHPCESTAGDAGKRSQWQISHEEAICISAALAWQSFSFATGYGAVTLFNFNPSLCVFLNWLFSTLALVSWFSFQALILVLLARAYVSLTRAPRWFDSVIECEGVHEGTLGKWQHYSWEEIESVSIMRFEGSPTNVAFRFYRPAIHAIVGGFFTE